MKAREGRDLVEEARVVPGNALVSGGWRVVGVTSPVVLCSGRGGLRTWRRPPLVVDVLNDRSSPGPPLSNLLDHGVANLKIENDFSCMAPRGKFKQTY